MAQLLLQQGKVTEALKYFERAAELSRTEGEIVNALSYAEATRTQLEVQEKYPQLASRLQGAGAGFSGAGMHWVGPLVGSNEEGHVKSRCPRG
jgi:import receptor subunit TOM70